MSQNRVNEDSHRFKDLSMRCDSQRMHTKCTHTCPKDFAEGLEERQVPALEKLT